MQKAMNRPVKVKTDLCRGESSLGLDDPPRTAFSDQVSVPHPPTGWLSVCVCKAATRASPEFVGFSCGPFSPMVGTECPRPATFLRRSRPCKTTAPGREPPWLGRGGKCGGQLDGQGQSKGEGQRVTSPEVTRWKAPCGRPKGGTSPPGDLSSPSISLGLRVGPPDLSPYR